MPLLIRKKGSQQSIAAQLYATRYETSDQLTLARVPGQLIVGQRELTLSLLLQLGPNYRRHPCTNAPRAFVKTRTQS